MKDHFIFTGENKDKILFPLGGIGSGSVGLTGNGRLRDWEIYNQPNKGSYNGFTHFAIKAERDGKVLDTRVLHGDLPKGYTGEYDDFPFKGYGFGPVRYTMAGFPSFKNVTFRGEFPIASITYEDEHFPGNVAMTAFNPFIPMNDKDSSTPGAYFEFEIENTSSEEITYTLCMSLQNALKTGLPQNRYEKVDDKHILSLKPSGLEQDNIHYGELTMATDGPDISYQEYWYRGRWFDEVGIFWRDFTNYGPLKNRRYEESIENINDGEAHRKIDTASLASSIQLQPGEKKTIRYVVAWYYPNYVKYWNPDLSMHNTPEAAPRWKNYYANLFSSSKEVATYALDNWDRLYTDTLAFKNALYSSTLPQEAMEAVGANLAIIKSSTCLRLDNGELYGWEGTMTNRGSCEGTCTHVWNYAYSIPFLFPQLERSIRDLDYKYNQKESGSMSFRLQLPLGSGPNGFRACADGQLGGILKVYREWRICGDDAWLKSIWPKVKKSLEFAWSDKNEDRWDPDKTGVLWGRQHHTLDMELFGPNSWLTGFYLAALKAASEIETYLGNEEDAREYEAIFKKGQKWVEENLFNGEYYHQNIDLNDKALIENYVSSDSRSDVLDAYWSEEHQEVKYQIGEGLIIDQVLAGWHANLVGLGDVFDKSRTKKALESLYRYNFKESMREFYNPCRLYALYDEAGIVMCDWPEGKYKPYIPVPYSEEVMNGFEYQSAIHMIAEGLVEEGLSIVRGVRDRYDGAKRNPYEEIECGSFYARSMASYALLLTYSGFSYHMAYKRIGFEPIVQGDFNSFWSIDGAWGTVEIKVKELILHVLYGQVTLEEFNLPSRFDEEVQAVSTTENHKITFNSKNRLIQFEKAITLKAGDDLKFVQ